MLQKINESGHIKNYSIMGKNKYLLCIDNGLTAGKVAVLDYEGNIQYLSSFKTEIINTGCFSEIEMEPFFNRTANAIKDLTSNSGIDPSNIVSIGNSGHGGGIYPLDRSGEPFRNAISSMDARGEDLISRWQAEGIDNYSKTFTNLWNGQAIPLLYWLKENEGDNYNRIGKVLFCKDWIKFKLTGEYSTDYTDASNAGLIDLNTGQYSKDLYSLYGMNEIFDKLPEINKTKETIGYVTENAAARTGLRKGTPVISGMVDFVACLIGSGLHDESAYSLVSGTWGINTAIKSSLSSTPGIMSTVLLPDNDNYLAMDTSPNSAVNLEWFLSEVLGKMCPLDMDRKRVYEKINNEIEKKDLSESGLFYFPFIYRSKLTKKMQGMFYGFNASHDLYDLISSIYEGVVFSHLMHIGNLQVGGIDLKRVILSGGATNSRVWCQIFSDILNMEITVTSSKEVGILGLAIYQAISQGVYKNLEEAIANMVKLKSVYRPDAGKHTIYKKRFTEFKRIMKLLDN